MRYYIADCHFFHRSLLTKMDCRGFETVDEMNEVMINNWNNKVRSNDEVIILGDFSLGTPEETAGVLQRLNGRLFLIRGNHDRFEKDKDYDYSRFEWIKDYEELNDNRRKVILCHYPILFYNMQYRLDENDQPKTYMLYGHVHRTHDERLLNQFIKTVRDTEIIGPDGEKHKIPCQMINCFCGFSDYTPLTLDEWIENDKARRG
ncbi:MAG: metallophosphoesterase family protein [Erysipelotrichaceae bacterium]|nr:metallophosphoesterase family protein [Erysipelotrichaceae bacterium]